MKNGDVVFFKTAKPASGRKAPTMQFQGHGFGIFLGHVPPFQKDPPPEHLLRLMGTVGFISFDDIGEFLAPEVAAEVVKKFEDKYWGKVAASAEQPGVPVEGDAHLQSELPLDGPAPEAEAPPRLVGIHGQPLRSSGTESSDSVALPPPPDQL